METLISSHNKTIFGLKLGKYLVNKKINTLTNISPILKYPIRKYYFDSSKIAYDNVINVKVWDIT